MGGVIQLDRRYSALIATAFIVMMYSAAIPILYIPGSLICFVTYWSDKTMFLNYYKLPPRYGRVLGD